MPARPFLGAQHFNFAHKNGRAIGGKNQAVCNENDVYILRGVLANDLTWLMKGRSSHKVQREFPQLKKRYLGCDFWGRGCFSTTNGATTEDIVLEKHIADPTDASRSVHVLRRPVETAGRRRHWRQRRR